MAAAAVYSWGYIAPGASVSVYVHGFPHNWATIFSAVVYPLQGDAYYPLGHINLTQTEVFMASDGTTARKAYVQNLAPFNPCAVDLSFLFDSF